MKFKIFSKYNPINEADLFTWENKKIREALEEFKSEYMKEFQKQDGKTMRGFRINITPLPPEITEESDGMVLNIPLPFPSWAMRLLQKKKWIETISNILKDRGINFKNVKYIGE